MSGREEEPKPPRIRSRSRSSQQTRHPTTETTAADTPLAQRAPMPAPSGPRDHRAPRSVVPRDILAQVAAEHGPATPAPYQRADPAPAQRTSRPKTKTPQLQRSPSAPAQGPSQRRAHICGRRKNPRSGGYAPIPFPHSPYGECEMTT
ncbi:unnamed protein product, partial [Brenthis ino]